jgi:hypothetical protein
MAKSQASLNDRCAGRDAALKATQNITGFIVV